MNARVKKEYRWSTLTAFSGHIFCKTEYRPIPKGFEKDAQAHPGLEIQFGMKPKEPVEMVEVPGVEIPEAEELIKRIDETVEDLPVVEKEKPFVKGRKAGAK